MPDVVTNTSPLLYLHRLRRLDLLPALYGKLVVPAAVVAELEEGARLGYDVPTREALSWAEIVTSPVQDILRLATDLGAGERAAIALAHERRATLLLLDDALARRHAKLLGLPISGTLGVLLRAKAKGHMTAITPLVDDSSASGFAWESLREQPF